MAAEIKEDNFDITKKDGGICPVVVYPKDKLEKISKIIKQSDFDDAKQKAFDSVEDLFFDMGDRYRKSITAVRFKTGGGFS